MSDLYVFASGFLSGILFMVWVMMKKGIIKVNGIKRKSKDKDKVDAQ